jgi:methionine aminotransferase
MDYSEVSAEPDEAFATRLTTEGGVASIPLSPFLYRQQAPRVVRFCFAKKDSTLEAAAGRLRGLHG